MSFLRNLKNKINNKIKTDTGEVLSTVGKYAAGASALVYGANTYLQNIPAENLDGLSNAVWNYVSHPLHEGMEWILSRDVDNVSGWLGLPLAIAGYVGFDLLGNHYKKENEKADADIKQYLSNFLGDSSELNRAWLNDADNNLSEDNLSEDKTLLNFYNTLVSLKKENIERIESKIESALNAKTSLGQTQEELAELNELKKTLKEQKKTLWAPTESCRIL